MKTYKFLCKVETTYSRTPQEEVIEVVAKSRDAAEKRLFKLGAGIISYKGEQVERWPELGSGIPVDYFNRPTYNWDKRYKVIGIKARHYSFV